MMTKSMDKVRDKYSGQAMQADPPPTVRVEADQLDEVPDKYAGYPAVVELWKFLRRYGRPAGMRLSFAGEGPALCFHPHLDASDPERWRICLEAVRLMETAARDLRNLNIEKMEE